MRVSAQNRGISVVGAWRELPAGVRPRAAFTRPPSEPASPSLII